MILEVLSLADSEIERAFIFYESQVPSLGFQFLNEIEESYRRILSTPRAWAALRGRHSLFHRCLLRRFPYGIIYAIAKNKIRVIAVMHLSRKPGYWKKRAYRC